MMPHVHEMMLKQLLVVEVDPSDPYKLPWIVGDWLLIFDLNNRHL
jgi:hypothetical protein